MKKLQIAVGIIRNENNEIFITRSASGDFAIYTVLPA